MSKFLNRSTKSSNTPPPDNKLNVKMSDHKLAISKANEETKIVETDAVKSYLEMRPKSYAEVFNDMFKASNLTLGLFHAISSILCFPLVFSLVWQYILRNEKSELKPLIDSVFADPANMLDLAFLLTLPITLLIVGLFEFWQHKTLKSCFKIKYQDKHNLPFALVLIAVMFSAVSIGSSGFGAIEVVEVNQTVDPTLVHNLDIQIADAMRSRKATNSRNSDLLLSKDNELAYLRKQREKLFLDSKSDAQKYSNILLIFSLVMEVMIFYTTRSIYLYMKRTMQDVLLFDDLSKGHNFLNLNIAELNSVTTTTPPDNLVKGKKKKKKKVKTTVPHRAPVQNGFDIFDLVKGKKTVNSSTGNAVIKVQKEKQAVQPQTFVHTPKTKGKGKGKQGSNFTRAKLNRYLRIYKGKVKDASTEQGKTDNQIRVNYIQYVLSIFDQTQRDGFVKFSIKDAAKWHKENRANLA